MAKSYKQTEQPLTAWSCGGCINTITVDTPAGPATYCRPMLEGRHRKEWQGSTLVCLDKIEGQLRIALE